MKKIIISLFVLLSSFSFSQTDSGDIESYLQNIISNMPGDSGNQFTAPTTQNLTDWENTIAAVLIKNIALARNEAAKVNYEIVEYTNTSLTEHKVFYILKEKAIQTNFWGTFIFSKNPERENLILQAPHATYDFNTGKQAIYCFKRLNNKALFLNGTHRCNHNDASTCDGTTSVCSNTSEAFKISDMAHNVNSVFQKTTEIVFQSISNSVFIQLHGFTKKDTDPYVILSNGTNQTPTTDYASMLKNELQKIDNSLTFKIAHIDTNWSRLRGFTNTQGRLINGSVNPCNTAATGTNGRFVHVEQEKSKLRQDMAGWNKMKDALSAVFTKTLNIDEYSKKIFFLSKNPFSDHISFQAKNMVKVELLSILGKSIYTEITSKENVTITTKNLNAGIYILKIYTTEGSYTKKLIHEQ